MRKKGYNSRLVCLTTALLLALQMTVRAEDITVLTFNHGDSVSLRWAPASEALFQKSVKSGYVVQRRMEGESRWNTISEKLLPLAKNKIEQMAENDPDAATVAEALYPTADRSRTDNENPDPYGPRLKSIPGEPSFEDEMLYVMAVFSCDISIKVAKAAALHFVDKSVIRTAKYQYRVVFSEDEGKAKADVGVANVDMSRITTLPTTNDFEGAFDERHVQFQWAIDKHTGYYSAYNIERSTDGVHFSELRSRPFVIAYTKDELKDLGIFRDTFPEDDEHIYYYRLKGYSPFGIYGPYSNVVKGEPKFNFDKLPIKVDTVIVGKKNEEIKWSFEKKYERKIKGFLISRTPDHKTFKYENTELIPPQKRSFKTAQKYDESQYYAVIAVGKEDKSGKRKEKQSSYVYSFRSDTIPPAIPSGLKATIDSAGVVSISWDPNNEKDIQGYQLYVSNSGKEDEYFTLTDTIYPQTSYSYQIPLNTLTNTIYYRVNAIDNNFNRSQWSQAVRLSKPDTIPPVPVVFEFIEQPGEKVLVRWENSPSEDVSYMVLARQIDDTGHITPIKRFDKKKKKFATSFEDPEEFKGVRVRYFMTIYDEVGNVSQTHTEMFQTKGTRPGCINNLKVVLTNLEDDKHVRLTWDAAPGTNIKRFVIYKKKDDGPMLDIASVRGNTMFYDDPRLTVGSVYKYIVRPISEERVCPAVYSEEVIFQGSLK